MTKKDAAPEFSRIVPVDAFQATPFEASFEATAEERAALAERLNLARLNHFDGSFRLGKEGEGAVLSGSWRAEVVQSCVATLEDVPDALADAFEIRFAPLDEIRKMDDAEEVELDADYDPPDPMPEDAIDAGAYLSEQLALSINPYPRKADAPLVERLDDNAPNASPFAQLARLKKDDSANS